VSYRNSTLRSDRPTTIDAGDTESVEINRSSPRRRCDWTYEQTTSFAQLRGRWQRREQRHVGCACCRGTFASQRPAAHKLVNSRMNMFTLPVDYPTLRHARRLTAAAMLSISCGGAAKSGPAVLSVGGTYQTQVSLVAGRNTCGAVTVQNNPTVVSHSPGASTLSLTHAGNAYPGTIESTARFATTPTIISGGGSQYTLTINGQFTLTGFDASVQVDVQQPTPPQSCSYLVHWIGTKDGSPNTIP
jgi:hypothetical protein